MASIPDSILNNDVLKPLNSRNGSEFSLQLKCESEANRKGRSNSQPTAKSEEPSSLRNEKIGAGSPASARGEDLHLYQKLVVFNHSYS